jgi:5-(carboxyamino)imidazole ribonucleotide synthase
MLSPGSVIGIVGDGQLARMLCQSSMSLGMRVHILSPNASGPATFVTPYHTWADYDDQQALLAFASAVDVITCEFENVPARTLATLASYRPVYPRPEIFAIAQHRVREKRAAEEQGIVTAPWLPVTDLKDLPSLATKLGFPCVLKTTTQGYDGKGQYRFDRIADITATQPNLSIREDPIAPWILEGWVPFVAEISVIVARTPGGNIQSFPPAQNEHKQGILGRSFVPSHLPDAVIKTATAYAVKLAKSIDVIGLLATEFFVTATNEVIFNEMAPRPHNSGHWTMDGCNVSQFEQAIRAICNWPLIPPKILYPTEMINLVGEEVLNWSELANDPTCHLHLYGKEKTLPGRKMGHVNRVQIR